jgi:hypothetical protein
MRLYAPDFGKPDWGRKKAVYVYENIYSKDSFVEMYTVFLRSIVFGSLKISSLNFWVLVNGPLEEEIVSGYIISIALCLFFCNAIWGLGAYKVGGWQFLLIGNIGATIVAAVIHYLMIRNLIIPPGK